MSLIARERDYSKPQEHGTPDYEFPFESRGDFSAFVVTRSFKQFRASYIADKLANRYPVGQTPDTEHVAALLVRTEELGTTPTGLFSFRRAFAVVPTRQIVPQHYAFATPNLTPINWSSAFTTVPTGSYAVAGNYAAIALASYTPSIGSITSAVCEAISGYYDVARAITAYTNSPATVLTIPGHNCVIGSRVLYRRTVGGVEKYYYFDVTGVAGDDLTGNSTHAASTDNSGGAGIANYLLPLLFTVTDRARKRTRARTDTGETVNLIAETIEDYYLFGVTPGVNADTDLVPQQPFQLAAYLEQWASAGTWFNVQATGLREWRGPIQMTSFTRALRPAS